MSPSPAAERVTRVPTRGPDPASVSVLARKGTPNCPAWHGDVPLVSIIVPVYNAAEYLESAVTSVFAQSLNAIEHCEVLLVNDGSTDGSARLCDDLARRYPHHVRVVHQANAGVSAARNRGLHESTGRFVCFVDADDRLGEDALTHALQVFLDAPVELDFVSMGTWFFGERQGQHHQNYRFLDGALIDVTEDWNKPQMSVHSTVIRGDVARAQSFAEGLAYAEDSLFMTAVLVAGAGRYGVARQARYHYRKRDVAGSAIDASTTDPRWYRDPLRVLHPQLRALAERSPDRALYCHMVSGYELQWRYRTRAWADALSCVSEAEARAYRDELNAAIACLDDRAIMAQRHLSREAKAWWYRQKHGANWPAAVDFDSGSPTTCLPPAERAAALAGIVQIELLEPEGGQIAVEGRLAAPFWPDARVVAFVDNHEVPLPPVNRPLLVTTMLDQEVSRPQGFRLVLPCGTVRFALRFAGAEPAEADAEDSAEAEVTLPPRYLRASAWSTQMQHNYRSFAKHLVTQTAHGLRVRRRTAWRRLVAEARFTRELVRKPRGAVSLVWRLAGLLARLARGRSDLWLISDRTSAAGDNGEFVFRHALRTQNESPRPTRYVYAIRKNSPDFKRLRAVGPVVPHGGRLYKVLFLAATHIVSSHADDYVTNPFGRQWWRYANLYPGHFVFLQHGVNNNDLAGWLNRHNKNISLVVTSMRSEHDDLVGDRYGYAERHVLLSGLPRFDGLRADTQRVLAIMPTWRQSLAGRLNVRTGVREYNRDFVNSAYFEFYQQLLSDRDIARACSDHDYRLEFYLHPALAAQTRDFRATGHASVQKFPHDYRDAIQRCAGLVTDYSSVAFDFAYLGKPTVYAHFDAETLHREHIYGGEVPRFFSHERDGFGPVTHTYAATKEAIIAMLACDAALVPPFAERVQRAFPVRDRRHTERVVAAIRALPSQREGN
ncbi:glycosyltransferase [Micrococcales bacterium 31B]|nr:glycosyltransferase [Micrococcales bacterium 31B]